MKLKDKVALVTGASSGIGEAVVKALAGKGVNVGIAARRIDRLQNLVQEIEQNGGTGVILEMDVTDKNSAQKGVEKLIASFGRIDILINNAGLMQVADIDSLKTDEWDRMIDVNIKGVLNTTAAALPFLMQQKSGHIINVSSIAGRKLFPGLAVYCATKHAVSAFSDVLRMEISAKYNIRVTSIQPGAVATELQQHTTDEKYQASMQESRNQMTFLTPDNIANSMVYALEAPDHVDVAELFILPTDQAW
ncbi:SDR family oxidoreductase [Spirosoma foliorum]|uniref:SDR family oxidoreductase n=1 Tax=Spirosoma foliorum TaxID=2710596 RepID=A0A7G5GVB4_9BACT|nr:SDR family oxidoreductase [Spirosoma foliorum]QMW02806.1 SDR family oxidoreductase [Spirosoma foliorum]